MGHNAEAGKAAGIRIRPQQTQTSRTQGDGRGAYFSYSYKGGGTVKIHRLINHTDSDYEKLGQVAEQFAIMGRTATLTPKTTRPPMFEYKEIYSTLAGTKYEGKCPDLNVDGEWYEHEGFVSQNPKRAFRNMLNDGLKQANRLIIDQPELTDAYMKRVIKQRVADGQEIAEIWIRGKKGITLLYKKSEGR